MNIEKGDFEQRFRVKRRDMNVSKTLVEDKVLFFALL